MNLYERFEALQFGWRDTIDILIVAFILYNMLLLIRGTRARQMALGLVLIASAWFVARAFDLLALQALSQQILFYLPFAIIILFQHEIRRALASFGRNPLISFFARPASESYLDQILLAAGDLARRKIGALIAIERTQSLRAYTEGGKTIDAIVSTDLLLNIFIPNTPLHDGAVVVQGDRIVAAGCFLPLSSNSEISKEYGTRHRAAVGLSEETDAFVIVISEENGSVAVAMEGTLHESLSQEQLSALISDRVAMQVYEPR